MSNGTMSSKTSNMMRKEIEDYYKAWVRKSFQKGIRDAKVIMADGVIVLLGIEFLSFVEQSILDDDYSVQAVSHTRKKLFDKNFSTLKQNLELITNRRVEEYYVDFNTRNNVSCVTIIMSREGAGNEKV